MTLAVTLLSLTGVTTGCETNDAERGEVVSLVNQSRAENGLKPVTRNVTLDLKADAWAKKLRDECALSHSELKQGAPKEWFFLGENVGYGGTIAQIHDAYLDSPGHRRNILDPRFTKIGAAAVWGTCDGQRRVFTVQVFMQTMSDR